MKIKKNDKVIVNTGKDKGTKGKVLKVFPDTETVVVEGVNMAKKHVSYRNKQGEVIEKAMPIHVSNVSIIDPKSNKATRVGYVVDEAGKKVRIAKDSGQKI
jgi:large subunit ribosomal protein L24